MNKSEQVFENSKYPLPTVIIKGKKKKDPIIDNDTSNGNFLDKFRNIMIGGSIAENPAFMTAVGWRNKDGNYVQDLQDTESTKRLRSNLSKIGKYAAFKFLPNKYLKFVGNGIYNGLTFQSRINNLFGDDSKNNSFKQGGKLINKAKSGIRVPEAKLDNTAVASRPFIPLQLSLIFYTRPSISQDNRNQALRDSDYRVGNYLNKLKLIKENAAKGLAGLGTFISPSTYIGPLVRSNGKDYATNVISGEGTGNAVGNLVTDVAAFGLPGLVKNGSNLLLIQAGKRGNLWAANKAMSNVFNKSYTGNVNIAQPIQTELVPQSQAIKVGKPYIRINPTWTYANEAVDVYPAGKPNQFFLLIKDNKTQGLSPNPNGEYSVHFKTTQTGITPLEKELMFLALEGLIPEGAKVSTWGKLTPGGYHGVNRFGNLFGYTRVGTRQKDIPVYLKLPVPTTRLYRAQGTGATFNASNAANGEAQRPLAGMWFTDQPDKISGYAQNALRGKNPAKAIGNLVTDIAAFGLPGLIRKGLVTYPKVIDAKPFTKYSDISTLKFLQKQSKELPNISKLPTDPKVLDTNVMAPEVRQYFTKQTPYIESFHSGRDHATVIGEYQNPLTLLYYDNIVKPLLKDHNDLLIKPIKVLEFEEQPKWAGLHKSDTLESFVGKNIPEVKSILIHETVGHGTDLYVNPKDYKFLFFNEDNHPFLYDTFLPQELDFQVKLRAMIPWYEQRATFEEARGELYEKACNQLGKTLNLKEFRDYIDNLSDLDIFKSMYVNSKNLLRNGYAGRMAMPFNEPRNIFLKKVIPPKDLVSKYRNLYKTLPTVGIPTILSGTYLNKKGESK